MKVFLVPDNLIVESKSDDTRLKWKWNNRSNTKKTERSKKKKEIGKIERKKTDRHKYIQTRRADRKRDGEQKYRQGTEREMENKNTDREQTDTETMRHMDDRNTDGGQRLTKDRNTNGR